MLNKLTSHLKENNMNYWQHLKFAMFFSGQCILVSIQLIVHAIFPCWFQKAGTNLVSLLRDSFGKDA